MFGENESNTSTAFTKSCLTKMPQTYKAFHSMASREGNDRKTQTDKRHPHKARTKKAPTCCYFLTEGTGSDCQTIDAQLVRGCAAPYVL